MSFKVEIEIKNGCSDACGDCRFQLEDDIDEGIDCIAFQKKLGYKVFQSDWGDDWYEARCPECLEAEKKYKEI